MQESFVVVFGSAAAFVNGTSSRAPRDLDVAFGGDRMSEADASAIASRWATENGLHGLPVDAHREYPFARNVDGRWVGNIIDLPTPAGLPLDFVVVHGSIAVDGREIPHAPAMLRRMARTGDFTDVARLTDRVIQDSVDRDFSLDKGRDFDAYSGCGVVAWRNAWAHVPVSVRPSIIAALNTGIPRLGDLIDCMLARDPRTERIPLPTHGQCAGGSGVVVLHRDGKVSYPYSHDGDSCTMDELIAAVFGGDAGLPPGTSPYGAVRR